MDMYRERHATFLCPFFFSLVGTTDLIFVLLIQTGIEVALSDIIWWSSLFILTSHQVCNITSYLRHTSKVSYTAPLLSYTTPLISYTITLICYTTSLLSNTTFLLSNTTPLISYNRPLLTYTTPLLSYTTPLISYTTPELS
jgi:hypothetical protein